MHSNNNQVEIESGNYFCGIINNKNRFNMDLNKSVEVKELPEMTVAYIRYIGPYKGDEQLFAGLWQKLFGWAGPRGLLSNKDLKSLVVYHDDPNITSEDKLRMSVCISVPEETKVGGEIGKMKIEAAKYAIARFELDASQFQQAWDWVYSQWLPNSGYQPDDKACFEMYPEEPKDGKFVVDICVPVKPI
jgi:AraC family transcriptional regulator